MAAEGTIMIATMARMMGTEDETGAHVIDQDIGMIETIPMRTCMMMGTAMKAGTGDGMTMMSPETASMLTIMIVGGGHGVHMADITEVDPGVGRETRGSLRIQ